MMTPITVTWSPWPSVLDPRSLVFLSGRETFVLCFHEGSGNPMAENPQQRQKLKNVTDAVSAFSLLPEISPRELFFALPLGDFYIGWT